jgi:RNA polymerase sigma factor FliA
VQNAEDHLGLVGLVVKGMRPHDADDYDQMFSDGALGLVQALPKFDLNRGFAPSTYLIPRIRGAVLDGRRERDRMTRGARRNWRQIQDTAEALASELCREPTRAEMLDSLDLSERRYDQTNRMDVATQSLPLDCPIASVGDIGTATLTDILGHDDLRERLDTQDRHDWLYDTLIQLDDRLQYVVTRYYLYGEVGRVIAENMGITESRVSQLRAEALRRLRVIAGVDVPQVSEFTPRPLGKVGDLVAMIEGEDLGTWASQAFAFGMSGQRRVNGLVRTHGATRRSWSRRFRVRGLHGPQHWITAGFVTMWLRVVRDCDSVMKAAVAVGRDQGSLSAQCLRVTGLRPRSASRLSAEGLALAMYSYLIPVEPADAA